MTAATILLLPAWDRNMLSLGTYLYASYLEPGDLDAVRYGGQIDYYKEAPER